MQKQHCTHKKLVFVYAIIFHIIQLNMFGEEVEVEPIRIVPLSSDDSDQEENGEAFSMNEQIEVVVESIRFVVTLASSQAGARCSKWLLKALFVELESMPVVAA